jgi:hypothetical protein
MYKYQAMRHSQFTVSHPPVHDSATMYTRELNLELELRKVSDECNQQGQIWSFMHHIHAGLREKFTILSLTQG